MALLVAMTRPDLVRKLVLIGTELAVIPRASHFVVMEKPALVNQLVLGFLDQDPVPTAMPVRRARS